MAKIIEQYKDGGGPIVHEPGKKSNPEVIKEREQPENYEPQRQGNPEETNLLPYEGKSPEPGKIYTLKFNTERDIKIPGLPKTISVFGWGIRIESIYKPEPNLLYVDIVPLSP